MDIRAHIKKHYKLLYGKKMACRINIPQGKNLAQNLGYPRELLDIIPEKFWDNFFPCGNPLHYLKPQPGDWILNLGSGAGIDSFAIFKKYGKSINIVSIDIVYEIINQAKNMAPNISKSDYIFHWICADGENLPFHNLSFNHIIMNGVFNLFPNKLTLIKEVHRIIKPDGRLVVADLSSVNEVEEEFINEPDAWAWCMSGAYTEKNIISILQLSGFNNIIFNIEEKGDIFNRIIFSCQRDS